MPHHCISHIKDVDGLSSAALVVAAKGGTFRLTDYEDIIHEMDEVPASATSLTICDLGTNTSDFPEFVDRLGRLAKRMPVTYIDHHFLTEEAKRKVLKAGVDFRHDVTECASMLTYLNYKAELPEDSRLLALFGAVTDYMDNSKNAGKIMETYDRHLVLFESTMLSYALARNGGDYPYAEMLVKELAKMRLPHTIDSVGKDAIEQAEIVRELADEVKAKGTRLGKLAYMKTTESATGNVAKLLIGAFDVPLGVAYKEKEGGRAEFSLRSTSECKLHLGKEVGAIAQKHGGSGGGHERAAGASVPVKEVKGFLKDIADRIEST